jgi:hypothetical protein
MTAALLFPGFDGLMTLSRRKASISDFAAGADRPLRSAHAHSDEEARQFIELTRA